MTMDDLETALTQALHDVLDEPVEASGQSLNRSPIPTPVEMAHRLRGALSEAGWEIVPTDLVTSARDASMWSRPTESQMHRLRDALARHDQEG